MDRVRICPTPARWNEVYKRLCRYAERHTCVHPKPPIPLILGGWNFSSDFQKMGRWAEMERWAADNGCPGLVEGLADSDFYWVHEPSADDDCGYGLASRLPGDNPARKRPSAEELNAYLAALKGDWARIAGPVLAAATVPLGFSGDKARSLRVAANPEARPPWGKWDELSPVESERRTFTTLRAAINRAVAPHEVDHVLFDTARWDGCSSPDVADQP